MTGLAPFTKRLAGKLSGGMKQKLGLACTLVHPPRLLLLDEPTVGVDPVSRRELWAIVTRFVRDEGTTVLLSTAYLDEAERCDEVALLDDGALIAHGPPGQFSRPLTGRTFQVRVPGRKNRDIQTLLWGQPGVIDAVIQGDALRLVLAEDAAPSVEALLPSEQNIAVTAVEPRFEDGFISLLRARRGASANPPEANSTAVSGNQTNGADGGQVIRAQHAQRRFGDFFAVKDVSFSVTRGEIFGLLGANGAGKTTMFRMLCGLLPASGGSLQVAGADVRKTAAAVRARIGYMSQKFSLYAPLSVSENLRFFSSAYGLTGGRRRRRIEWAREEFDLASVGDDDSGMLPLGYKQRSALACADARAGDHLSRRADLGRRSLGPPRVLAAHQPLGGPGRHGPGHHALHGRSRVLRPRRHHDGRRTAGAGHTRRNQAAGQFPGQRQTDHGRRLCGVDRNPRRRRDPMTTTNQPGNSTDLRRGGSLMRLRGMVRKEFLQVARDPSALGIAFVLPVALLLLFGYGVSLDAEHVPVALVVDKPTGDTNSFCAEFEHSLYFEPVYIHGAAAAQQALMERRVDAIVHLRADFSEKLRRPGGAPVQVVVNGVDANTARIVNGYVAGAFGKWLERRASESGSAIAAPVNLEQRVWFNENVRSRDFLLPGVVALVMTLIGALLTALLMRANGNAAQSKP